MTASDKNAALNDDEIAPLVATLKNNNINSGRKQVYYGYQQEQQVVNVDVKIEQQKCDDATNSTRTTKTPSNVSKLTDTKTIGLFASIMLLMNTMTGPAMIQIPPVYQSAGYITPTVIMLLVVVVSSLSSACMAEAMARIPGNENFDQRIEFLGLVKFYFNRWGYLLTNIMLNINLQANTIACIIASAQTMDFTLIAIFKTTFGLEFYPHFGITFAHEAGDSISPFGNVYLLSLGFVIVFLMCLPMGLLNLDDNIWSQAVAIIVYIGVCVLWTIVMCFHGFDFARIPVMGKNQTQVLGNILFNFNFAYVVPSWINQKKRSVGVNAAIWASTLLVCASYLIMGILGAWAYDYPNNEDLLSVVNTSTQHVPRVLAAIASISVFVFPIPTFLSGVPVNSIIVKYNLVEEKICRKGWANFWAVIFPWIISVPFCTGSGLTSVCNWSSLICGGFICFTIPMLCYILAVRKDQKVAPMDWVRVIPEPIYNDKMEKNATAAAAAAASINASDFLDEAGAAASCITTAADASHDHHHPTKTTTNKVFRAFPTSTRWRWFKPTIFVWIVMVLMVVLNLFVIVNSIVQAVMARVDESRHHHR